MKEMFLFPLLEEHIQASPILKRCCETIRGHKPKTKAKKNNSLK